MDVHNGLLSYAETLEFFEEMERNSAVKAYCRGSNLGGRWIFQIYNVQFVEELAKTINDVLDSTEAERPVLEIMSGDGKLTEFLQPFIQKPIIATDAKDGRYNIAYPKWVETLDALKSIEKYHPSFIIMSWEPYLSMTGIEAVQTGVPTAWVGNPKMCGHPDLFEIPHIQLRSRFSLSRHDSFAQREFKSDVFLFNCNANHIIGAK